MMYHHFAYIYDYLMKDVPYDKWVQFLHQSSITYGNGGKRVLDLACGTGEISYRLAQLGYHVTGVDLSEDMLAIAQEKMEAYGQNHALFVKQDMRSLHGFQPFDYIFICVDAINYLLTKEDVLATFQHVFEHLNDGGLLIFDVHSVYKVENLLKGNTFADNDDEISYIWNCFEGSYQHSVVHELTFFVRNGENYKRYDEDHEQRTFSVQEYKQMLMECRLSVLKVLTAFEHTPMDQAERIFFIARKEGK